SEAVVIAREDRPGQKRLVGYAIASALTGQFASHSSTQERTLRQFLQDRLPSYMVPSAIVCLETFPLTPSGKVDRRVLPVPNQPAADDFVTPETVLEKALAHIWETVLGIDQIGLKADFFELGGHSLLATQVITRIREDLNREVSFHQFFETSQLGALAAWLSTKPSAPKLLQLKPSTHDEFPPLTWMQEPLWFLDQLMAKHPFYTVPEAFRLEGALSVQALAKSLQTVVDRHEPLRTTFEVIEGKPVQVIHRTVECPFLVVDLSSLPEADREREAQIQLVEAARTPFDLAKDVLLRATLFKLGETDHILLLNLHHIVCDGWSVGVLMQEIETLYTAYEMGAPSPLSPLPVQYTDFTLWHRQWLSSDLCERQLDYWQKQLGDGVPRLALPTDFPRPAMPTYAGRRKFLTLSDDLTHDLKNLARESGTTLFMVLLAAFQTLLYRYSGQDDIAVGSLLANRLRPELESLIGFFPNTVVLRTDLTRTPSFQDLLLRVKEVTLGAYAHQDVPFDQVVQALHPDHDPGQNPFFQVLFNLQNTPVADWQHTELSLTHLKLDNKTTKFDLFLELTEDLAGLSGYFEYSTDLFKPETINRMGGHFLTLLESIVAHPDQSIAELSLFTEAERQQLASWNKTQTDYPKHQCLHELIETQVAATPDAIALQFQDQQLSYSTLNRRVNQCARYLRALGVRPGTLVGVFMERSLDLVIALLAVLKAGGAYVPLDPIYPKERLEFMVEDSGLSVLLTQSALRLQGLSPLVQVVCLDSDWPMIAQSNPENLRLVNTPDDLAYTIYTSGSTGKPKGVQIQHRALVNFLWSMKQTPGLTAEDVLVAVTTICFDIAGLELYLPLITGAQVILASRESASDPQQLAQLLATSNATVMQATPATWRMLLATGWSGQPQLKILCGGEPLPRDLADQLIQRGQSLWNLYGPTETTIWSAVYEVDPGRSPVPIGWPIANTQIYLLNPVTHGEQTTLQPVPVGVTGELYIGGDGLAKGYLNRPDLTEEKFIPNLFDPDPNARLYRTGDLARYLPDGALECLGRIDHQVKIRGFRIELGDIEAALNHHQAIQSAVVVAREESVGNKQLVAYLVADEHSINAAPGNQAQTQKWQTVWDETYRRSSSDVDPTFNITGWSNSYTGQPMPADEMREWVDHTVNRILALQPDHVLEIGCGTGLLLYRVAPHCQAYQGLDLAESAIQAIQHQLQNQPINSDMQLSIGAADSLSTQDLSGVDTVVINSVAQYFPNIQYLVTVLDPIVRGLQPGSRIFIGDVRSLPLLEAFHTAIQLFQAEDALPVEQLQQRIQERFSQERELAIDPQFFEALQHHYPAISQVEIQLKRGQHHNELTQFRYDVVLHIGSSTHPDRSRSDQTPILVDWQPEMRLAALRQQLVTTQPTVWGLKQVPNARLVSTLRAMALLHQPDAELTTVANLRAGLQHQAQPSGLDPEDLWRLGEELAYRVSITWSQDGSKGTYDVIFQQR
ncbi:MAG: amino acid adenylation domain-containing protein, partial [Cyanobacteria bacterium P01_G01_bin.38]